MKNLPVLITLLFLCACASQAALDSSANWEEVVTADGSTPVARHEAAFIKVKDKFYLLGGRSIRPVSIYDTKSDSWAEGSKPPIEIHHFQPVVYQDEIYLMGAMTGGYPGETPVEHIYIYNPADDSWRKGAEIPADRRRGGAGVVLHKEKFYLVCGIRDGHRGDHKTWLDEYDPATGQWRILPDAPRPRDHFQAVMHGDQLYALAGRTTIAATNPFANTIGEVDVFDFNTNKWTTLPNNLPTLRAGNIAMTLGNDILVMGGESDQLVAHNEVEALDVRKKSWRKLQPLSRGRHGTGVVKHNGYLYMASGCGNHGGEPELADMIKVELK